MAAYNDVPLGLICAWEDGDDIPDLDITESATLLCEVMLIERYLQPGAVATKLCSNPHARCAYSV